MASDTVPAAVPGPNDPPHSTAPTAPHGGTQQQPGGLAGLLAPVEPTRSAAFNLNPDQTAAAPHDETVAGASSSAFTGGENPEDAAKNTKNNSVGGKQERSVVRAWLLAGAERWRKGADARNKALDIKKAKAQARQIKENVTVNRAEKIVGGSTNSSTGNNSNSGKSLNNKASKKDSGGGQKNSSGGNRSGGRGNSGGTHKNGSGNGSGAGGNSGGSGRDRSAGGKGSGTSSGRGTGTGSGSGNNGTRNAGKDRHTPGKQTPSSDKRPSSSDKPSLKKPDSGGKTSSGGSNAGAGKAGPQGPSGKPGKDTAGQHTPKPSKPDTRPGKPDTNKGPGNTPTTPANPTGNTAPNATGPKAPQATPKPGPAAPPGTLGKGLWKDVFTKKPGNTRGTQKGEHKAGDADAKHTRGTSPAPRLNLQKSRETGYRDGTRAAKAVAHAHAWRDGARDGYRDTTQAADREKARLDRAHADRKNARTQPGDQPVTQPASSADYQQAVPPKPTQPPGPQPVPVASIDASHIHLGPGAARPHISRGEVRTLRHFQNRLAAKNDSMTAVGEATRTLEQHATEQARQVTQLLEQAKTVKGGERLVAALTKLQEQADLQATQAAEIHKRAVRAAEGCKALSVNADTRYGGIYKAVVDSPETTPAEMTYYREMADA
jgi:hypothetical protein